MLAKHWCGQSGEDVVSQMGIHQVERTRWSDRWTATCPDSGREHRLVARGPETAQNSTPGFYLPLIKDKGKVDLDRARQSKKTYKSNKLAVRTSSSICGHSCIMLYLVAMSFCFRHVLSCQIKMQHGVAQLIGTGCLASYFLAMDVKSWRITEARWSSPDKLIGRNIRDYKKGRKN